MFFLTLAAVGVSVAAESRDPSLNSRSRRDFYLDQETVEERLHSLIESDTHSYKSIPEDRPGGHLQSLQERSRWLIRIFEIGLAKDKKVWERKRDTLRFFRENSHVFSGHTDYVALANQMPVLLENMARELAELGYEPLETLKMAYTVAFREYWLQSSKEVQLAILREAIRPAKLQNYIATSSTSTTSQPTIVYSSFLDLPDSDEDIEDMDSEVEGPGEMSLPIAEEVVTAAEGYQIVSSFVGLILTVIVVIL